MRHQLMNLRQRRSRTLLNAGIKRHRAPVLMSTGLTTRSSVSPYSVTTTCVRPSGLDHSPQTRRLRSIPASFRFRNADIARNLSISPVPKPTPDVASTDSFFHDMGGSMGTLHSSDRKDLWSSRRDAPLTATCSNILAQHHTLSSAQTMRPTSGRVHQGGGSSNKATGRGKDKGRADEKKKKLPKRGGNTCTEMGGEDQDEDLLWACPYYKFDPHRYERCLGKYELRKPSDVKQHLERCHSLKDYYHCPKCWRLFPCVESQDEHIRTRSCDSRPGPEELMEYELESIKTIASGLSTSQKWYRMWDLLFVGYERPESPHVERIMAESRNIMLSQAEPILRERLPDLLMRTTADNVEDHINRILHEIAVASQPLPARFRRQFSPPFDAQQNDSQAESIHEPGTTETRSAAPSSTGFLDDESPTIVVHPGHNIGGEDQAAISPTAAPDANHLIDPTLVRQVWVEPNGSGPNNPPSTIPEDTGHSMNQATTIWAHGAHTTYHFESLQSPMPIHLSTYMPAQSDSFEDIFASGVMDLDGDDIGWS